MPDPWVIMPVVAHRTYTDAAIASCLAQTVPCRVLVINQGVDTPFRRALESKAEDSDRLFVWSHQPPLPSLAATWNHGLYFAWECGAAEALVVNNDVVLAPNTLELLCAERLRGALLVTGVSVTAQQFQPGQLALQPEGHGGPDFSCFLIDAHCHGHFSFDEGFVPAYCEDVDLHRRMLLEKAGHRAYSINLPFLHHRSTTIGALDAKERAALERRVEEGARAHYRKKWGGNVNEERYVVPFDPESATDHVTTPELQEAAWANVQTS